MAFPALLRFICVAVAVSADTEIFGVHLSMTYGYSASERSSISSTVEDATHLIIDQLIEDSQICITSGDFLLHISPYANIYLQTLNALISCCNASSQGALVSSLESDFVLDLLQLLNTSYDTAIDADSSRTIVSAIVTLSSDPTSAPSIAATETSDIISTTSTTIEANDFKSQQGNSSSTAEDTDDESWRWLLFLFLMVLICVGVLNHHKKHSSDTVENALFTHQLEAMTKMDTERRAKIILTSPTSPKRGASVTEKDEYDTPDIAGVEIRFDDAYAKTGRTSNILAVTPGRLLDSLPEAHKALGQITEEAKSVDVEREGPVPTRQTSSGAADQYEFMKWLELLDLKEYGMDLMNNGFTCAADLVARIENESELVDYGIDDEDDRKTLWCEIVEMKQTDATHEQSEW